MHDHCTMCGMAFGTDQALKEHEIAANHRRIPCGICMRKFRTTRDLQNHKYALHICVEPQWTRTQPSNSKAVSTILALESADRSTIVPTPFRSTQGPDIVYKGHDFTMFDAAEQHIILWHLLQKRHSVERLLSQGYILSTTPVLDNTYTGQGIIQIAEFQQSPESTLGPSTGKRHAVVIDCEMVETSNFRKEVAFICAVDFLTGQVLFRHYVRTEREVTRWMSRTSGVTPSAMANAVANGQSLSGWKAAREALWRYISSDTVLIGQSLNSDLNVLDMFHSRIVDSAILTAESVFLELEPWQPLKRLWSLKRLANELLDYNIQGSSNGHDCLEDTLTTREIIIWCLRNPEYLEIWAAWTKEDYDAELIKQKKLNEEKQKQMRSYYETLNLIRLSTVHPRNHTGCCGVIGNQYYYY